METECSNHTIKAFNNNIEKYGKYLKLFNHQKNQYLKNTLSGHALYDHLSFFPGDTINSTFEITTFFGNWYFLREGDIYGLPIGQYTLSINYIGEEVMLESNQVTFEIVKPTGFEKDAFQQFSELQYMFSNQNIFSSDSIINKANNIVKSYSNSVYATSSLIIAAIKEKGKSFQYLEEMMKSYPDNRITSDYLKSLMSKHKFEYKDKAWEENYLKEIVSKYPGTLVASEAQKSLKEILKLSYEEWLNPEFVRIKKEKEYLSNKP